MSNNSRLVEWNLLENSPDIHSFDQLIDVEKGGLIRDNLNRNDDRLKDIYIYPSKRKYKKDNRLFEDFKLYCEGEEKPLFRGYFHVLGTFLLCLIGLQSMVRAADGNILSVFVGSFFVFTNIFCYGISSLYHVGTWSVNTEILIQKLDHCGIAFLSMGSMFPVIFILFPAHHKWYQMTFLFCYAVSSCLYVCYNIIHLRPSTFRQILCAASILPFTPWLYYLMTPLEWQLMWSCVGCQAIGVCCYVSGRNSPYLNYFNQTFGYHEFFHLFVTAAGACAYICNLSIVDRFNGRIVFTNEMYLY